MSAQRIVEESLPVAIIRGSQWGESSSRVQKYRGRAEEGRRKVGFWCQKQCPALIGLFRPAGIDRHSPPKIANENNSAKTVEPIESAVQLRQVPMKLLSNLE